MTDLPEMLPEGVLLSVAGALPVKFPGKIVQDSRQVSPGDLFIAVPGSKADGMLFIPDAVSRGAAIVVSEKDPGPCVPCRILVRDARCAATALFRAASGYPDRDLTMLGVTGTNGKTTTAFLMQHLFQTAGVPCGLLSTVEVRDGSSREPALQTTPDASRLFPLLARMRGNGLKAAAMELSSHALDQKRADGIRFQTAVFTNLTGDHLDYHRDMEHYYQAKKSLFTRLLAENGTAVVNADDPAGRRLAEELHGRKICTFGSSPGAQWQLCDVCGEEFRLVSSGASYVLRSPLCGTYNLHNTAGAFLAALSCGLPAERLTAALRLPFQVPGRLERLCAPNGAAFFVDYAHTDDALANALRALRPRTRGRLLVLFGAGGDRDRTKRPRMGRAAAENADLLFLTSDNPRSESPDAIIAEILGGIPAGTSCIVEPDRRKALEKAFQAAGPEDCVLVAGKGHENYQEINGVRHPFDDRAILKEFGCV